MSKNKKIRGFLMGGVIFLMGGVLYTPIIQVEAVDQFGMYVQCSTEESEAVSTRAAQLVWYYKVEGGKKYRRLYDATNQKWLTEWILCE